MKILINKKTTLRQSDIYITEDYPKNIAEIRRKLHPIMKEKRNEGLHAIIKYDKLYVDGKIYTVSNTDLDAKRKREEKESPKGTQVTQNKKVFKTNPISKNTEIQNLLKENIRPILRTRTGSIGNLTDEKLTHSNLTSWLKTNDGGK